MNALPAPSADALAHSECLTTLIRHEITEANGWISFARFMELALYAPGLGYYAAGAQKFGAAGDFITAPEMTPLFAHALARQVSQVLQVSAPAIIEAGAGSGRLAADLLQGLEQLGCLPESYAILELSAELRQRQWQTLNDSVPCLLPRITWLDHLPQSFAGVILGNEVLDAMPVHSVTWRDQSIYERGVSLDATGNLDWQEHPATGAVLVAAQQIGAHLPSGFSSEIALAGPRWVAEWAGILTCGALILIDYGFPRREFYHPQRDSGTLMCHYRHFAHHNPFYLPGLQDITAHVDFTAIVAAGHAAGLDLLGYTTQGAFLLNCGLLPLLEALEPGTTSYLRAASACNQLLLPQEMGELFKVIALGRGINETLLGFIGNDQSFRL